LSNSPLSKVTDRVGNLVELLTTLDKRILATLDSLEELPAGEMQTLMSARHSFSITRSLSGRG
jgi:hypothetical protein